MSRRNSLFMIGSLGLLICALQFQAFGQSCTVQRSGRWTKYSLCFETQSYNAPYYLEFGPNGNLWFSDIAINRLSSAGYSHFATSPGCVYCTIAIDVQGNIWFAPGDYYCYVSKLTPTGKMTQYSTLPSCTKSITEGPDGNIWYTGFYTNTLHQYVGLLGRVTAAGVITTFVAPIPANVDSTTPYSITVGPDKKLWFTDPYSDTIGRFDPSTQKFLPRVKLDPAGTPYPFIYPYNIKTGSDGNLWFTTADDQYGIGRVTPSGAVKKFGGGQGQGIDSSPDGTLWYAKRGTALGHIDPRTSTFLPSVVPPSSLFNDTLSPVGHLTVGPDGRVWFVAGTSSSHWIGVYQP